jgi:DNA invertase Pin-like site-specific DNA recombinase
MSRTQTRTYDSLIRVSRVNGRQLGGNDGGHTIRSQTDKNRHAIENLGGRVGRVYRALDESGSTIFASPEWLEALDRVKRGDSAGVAVEYIDRMGRNTPEGLAYVAQMTVYGGQVIVDGRPVDFTDPYEKAMFAQAMVQAELTVDIAKQRARRTMNDVQARGIANRVSYGYDRNEADGRRIDPARDRKALVINDEQAAVVKLIFTMRADGERWPAIIDELHRRGVLSPTGQPYWTTGTLTLMVKSRVYRGEVKMGGHVTKGAHKPIVTEQLWKAAQSKATRVRTGKHKPGVAHGLLTCSGCGGPLSVQQGGQGFTFYGCRRQSGRGPCPGPVNGSQAKLDEFVDGLVAEALDGEHGLDVVGGQQDLTAAKAAMDTAVHDRAEFLKGTRGMDAAVIAEALEGLNADVERTQEAYTDAVDRADTAADLPESGDAYRRLPVDRRRGVAASLIEELVLDPFPKGAMKRGANPADRVRRPIRWAV